MSIFKAHHICGRAATDLTPELFRRWGFALGRQLEPKAKFVAGGDVRDSTAEFLAALIDGLCLAGLDVVDLGTLPTPMIHYAKRRIEAAGCAIVTASHGPADTNGLKWMLGDRPPTPEEVRLLEKSAETTAAEPSGRARTAPRTLDVTFDYVAWLQETWVKARHFEERIVLDPGHGCWAARARRYLQAVFPRCLFSAIHDTPDAAFGGRLPDCSRPEQLEELADAVYQERARLGIAFDGDGDRVAFVDNEGSALTAEEATWLMLQSVGPQLDRRPFVYDLKFSDRIAETAVRLGAEPLVERSGHSFIHSRMLETGAGFGAQIHGHYFFDALGGGDDGLFAACQMIAHLARCKVTLAELRRVCPPAFITPDLRVSIAPERREAAIDQVRAAWSEYPQTAVDGVRVSFSDGWALMRSSVSEPALTFRFESSGWSILPEMVHAFCETLGDLGDELWNAYEAAMVGAAVCRSRPADDG